jgi:hypothetical protein
MNIKTMTIEELQTLKSELQASVAKSQALGFEPMGITVNKLDAVTALLEQRLMENFFGSTWAKAGA